MKKKIWILLLVALICFPVVSKAATKWYIYHVLSFWSVDSGKHLDWSGSTSYSSNWSTGVSTWNNYKSGVIRQDTILTTNDVTITDVASLPNNIIAVTTYPGGASGHTTSTIKFSTPRMNNLTNTKRNIVCTHELGHALGLNENEDSGTAVVMYPYMNDNTSNNVLHNEDKLNYDYMYNNNY